MADIHNYRGRHMEKQHGVSRSPPPLPRPTRSGNSGNRQDVLRVPRRNDAGDPIPPPVLVYHESARSIVFRDHLKRASSTQSLERRHERILQEHDGDGDEHKSLASSTVLHRASSEGDVHDSERNLSDELTDLASVFLPNPGVDLPFLQQNNVQIKGFQPHIVPLQKLDLGHNDEYLPLYDRAGNVENQWNEAEKEVMQLLRNQRAVVKTVKDSDWTDFLLRFRSARKPRHGKYPTKHDDIPPHEDYPFNSFVTSTSLLPSDGRKMRCYGSTAHYNVGVLFALPSFDSSVQTEQEAINSTETWSWPSGYSAKTEFNIDDRGRLINGRKEALVPFSKLREYNNDYLSKTDYVVGGRVVRGGLNVVPYNEIYVRVGGIGRIVNGQDVATGRRCSDSEGTGRSLATGIGLPAALFVRSPSYGHLISLFRIRARLLHAFGEKHVRGIPLLMITPEGGAQVITEAMQRDILKMAAKSLNPFQNPVIAHTTTIHNTSGQGLQTKMEELIELDESIRTTLTPEECGRLAGGFGVTDESIAHVLKDALAFDRTSVSTEGRERSHMLQDIVNEGLAAAVQAGDYHTSRQLLILYTLVAAEGEASKQRKALGGNDNVRCDRIPKRLESSTSTSSSSSLASDAVMLKRQASSISTFTDVDTDMPVPPPPPPLDTDRLRSATNSDGLLAVLGAAQVLKAMKDGSAQRKANESISSIEEWIEHGEQSIAFRLASWRDQRAAQGDLKIATQEDSSFMAFVSNKAISNRRAFASQLKDAVANTDFRDVRFLHAILEIVGHMHSPCLRLELLQYVLGLDNRYSVAHVKRSVELAATCLSIASASALSST